MKTLKMIGFIILNSLISIVIIFSVKSCKNRPPIKEWHKAAIITYCDGKKDTIASVVYAREAPAYTIRMNGPRMYLTLDNDLSTYDVVAVDVKSFREIQP